MSDFETYLMLFTDCLVSNLAFNISSEVAIVTMKIFNIYNPYMVIITASGAYLITLIINYYFGRICFSILSNNNEERLAPYGRIIELRKSKYLFVFIILSAIPFFGKFVILFTGFCHIKITTVIYCGILAKIVYYSYFILA